MLCGSCPLSHSVAHSQKTRESANPFGFGLPQPWKQACSLGVVLSDPEAAADRSANRQNPLSGKASLKTRGWGVDVVISLRLGSIVRLRFFRLPLYRIIARAITFWPLSVGAFRSWSLTETHSTHMPRSKINSYAGFKSVVAIGNSVKSSAELPPRFYNVFL